MITSLYMQCTLASFPGRFHRQYFIASSMKYGRGRPGRSGHIRCHQVDTWLTHGGRCPTKNLDVLCCTVRTMAGYQSVRKADDQYRSLFTTPRTERHETGILTAPCVSTIYLPDVIARDQISQAFPRRISYWKR